MIIRDEIKELKKLGRMPNESLDDEEDIDLLIEKYENLLSNIKLPISLEEGLVLVNLFPENAFYDLHWELVKLVESLSIETVGYENLISQCPSKEWRDALIVRLENGKRNKK